MAHIANRHTCTGRLALAGLAGSLLAPASAWAQDAARILPKPKGLPVTVVRGPDAETGQLFPEDVEQIARFF